MCALVTFTSVSVAAASAILLIMTIANAGKLTKNAAMLQSSQNYSDFIIDPNGPTVQFILFTRSHPPYNLKIGDSASFNNSGFDRKNPTKIIIHGFQSSIKENIFVVNKNAYLTSGNYNIIGMDWSALCDFEYLSSLRGARQAGKVLGDFINWLNGEMDVDLDDIHLVGHSLGAHVAGIAGYRVKNGKVSRITGLDPAGPGFRDIQADLKLDSNDAKLVDVIHTYMKVLSLAQPLGHVDFYPNGGRRQPGCPDISDIWKVSESLICNHARSYYYFAESIGNKRAFKSKRCTSVETAINGKCDEDTNVYMGQVETYRFGLYYVRTRATRPYTIK